MKRAGITVLVFFLSLFVTAGYLRIPQVIAQETASAAGNDGAVEWAEDLLLSSPQELDRTKIPVKAKGIYLTGWSAGNSNFQKLLNLVNETELNAMVIDMKEDEGRVTYQSGIPLVKEVKSDGTRFIHDIDQMMQTLKENHVYTIARIVCFKDPFLAGKKLDWAMKRKTGGVWSDKKGVVWIDPYRKEVWDYNIALAKEAAMKGFNEIQFDYVRFPDNGKKVDQEVAFYQQSGRAKQQVISDFLAYARKELAPYNVYISADIFGLVTSVTDDMGIGQKWELVSPHVDYVSPMMYPSHYANGTYGLAIPDARPYETIYHGLQDAQKKDQTLMAKQLHPAIIRPWYQDFTARWVKGHIPYGPREVQAQIKAGRDLGVEEYLIWDAGNTYSEGAWRK
ncbi:MAG TPA: putative glycoside hydrolase [Candidatus Bathyarchaeia archaeon]|nr:putative glycoside hydrolase [Candidatus Bathyarchaeia archaeon]